jgi:FkbM family methyltransferase
MAATQRLASRREPPTTPDLVFAGHRFAYSDPGLLRYSIDEIFVDRSYATPLPPEPTIVDCGANIGVATAFFVSEHPGSRVIAFEPDPSAFELLTRNIERNRWQNVTAHNVAVGAENGTSTFFRDPGRPASLVGSTTRRVLGEELSVETRRLSELLPESVDLLKLDIEGAEVEVLDELISAGALERVAVILVEFHHDPERPALLADFLRSLGEEGFACELRSVGPGAAPPGESAQDVLIHASRRA